MTAFERVWNYANDIISGEIVAGQKHIWAAQRFINDIYRIEKEDCPFYFDADVVEDFDEWAKQFVHSEGVLEGQPIILNDFQLFLAANIFGFKQKDNDARRFRKVYIQLARKNAKSQFLALIATYEVFLSNEKHRVYIAGWSKEQSEEVYMAVSDQIRNAEILKGTFKGFMLEWSIIPALMIGAAFVPNRKQNDRKTIELIFKNVGYGIRDKKGELRTPRYKSKEVIKDGEEVIGTVYKFSIIPGLPATNMKTKEKESKVFSDGLRKPVEIEFKHTLNISVYDEELKTFIPYKTVTKNYEEWVVPIGKSLNGMVYHNFDLIPHMTVAGTTRFGKSVMLRMMMTYLIETHDDDVEFYIIDLKGLLEFGRYERLKQVKQVAGNPKEAVLLLNQLEQQYQKDYIYFRKNYFSNVVDTKIQKRKFVIVDEAAQLAPEKWMPNDMKNQLNYCQTQLSKIAYLTGALGYRLIFATQYPTSDTLPRMIKQNADDKISFRLPSGYASGVAIDEYGAEQLPSDIKGRALFKTHELKELQVPFISHDEMWKILQKQVKGVNNGKSNTDTKETSETGTNFIKFGNNEVRNKGTNSKDTQTREGQKYSKDIKRNEGISSSENSRGQEHLLPKRKGKGTSWKRN